MEVIVREDERIDDLQRNGYQIIQKKGGFCFGMDAVLLSGFANVKEGENAIDLGTGTGIVEVTGTFTVTFLVIYEAILAIQIVGEGERGQPVAGNFHFHGRGTVGGRNNHAGGEEESKELLHDAHP